MTLHGRGELDTGLLVELLAIPDAHRQIQALRAGVGLLDGPQLVAAADQLTNAPEMVRVQYAFALGALADDPEVRAVLARLLAADQDSVFVRQAVVRAVNGQELPFIAEAFTLPELSEPGEGLQKALAALGASAYRSIRQDMSGNETPPPAMLDLLALTESRRGDLVWQQIALLSGFQSLARSDGFVPANLAEAPAIFSDTTISENDPLWNARLSGRVAFTWPGDELALGIKPLSPEQMALMEKGRAYYPTCGNCHGASGAGTAGLAPALAGTEWVTGPPEWLARIILQGLSGPVEVNGETWNGVMPPHGHLAELDDETLAGLMTYLRRS